MNIRTLIGFRERAKLNWRGKPKTLKLRYRKMVKAGKLGAEKLKALGMHLDADRNSLEDILCALAIAGQHEYVGAYYRNQSLNALCLDERGWLGPYAFLRNVVEGCHGHQKDWLDLDNLKTKGLRRARLNAALCMLSEAAVAYIRVQNGKFKVLTSRAFIR